MLHNTPTTTPPQPLTLDEFIFEQLKTLEDFESSWRQRNLDAPEDHPMEMWEGEWAEQLGIWSEREDATPNTANK